MSELVAHKAEVTIPVYGTIADAEVYLKSEADKVIAEKDKELRHQKYKRCLAMAYVEWLKQMNLCNYSESILYRSAARRELKWKGLAEKFKPNKDQ